jgi:hypothetical protein
METNPSSKRKRVCNEIGNQKEIDSDLSQTNDIRGFRYAGLLCSCVLGPVPGAVLF